MKHNLFFLLMYGMGVFLWNGLFSNSSSALDLHSKQALLIDMTTRKILYEKNAKDRVPPSSMTKIMTAYLAFAELKASRLSFNTPFKVSEKAWRTQGSRMFLNLNSTVTVKDLLKGIIIQSGNDASIALAEGMCGSEENFARRMTEEAHRLGASTARFLNSSGWPEDDHLCSMWDLALISMALIQDFPDYYPMFREIDFTHNNIRQMNRNPILYDSPPGDGLKTGHTEKGGYGVVASAIRGKRRLILAINGAEKGKQRAEDVKSLMNWGFYHYASPLLFESGEEVDRADVWLGSKTQVPLVIAPKRGDVFVTLLRQDLRYLKMETVFNTPIQAPVQKGQPLGKLIVTSLAPDHPIDPIEVPLVAGEDVQAAPFLSRFTSALYYLFMGHH